MGELRKYGWMWKSPRGGCGTDFNQDQAEVGTALDHERGMFRKCQFDPDDDAGPPM